MEKTTIPIFIQNTQLFSYLNEILSNINSFSDNKIEFSLKNNKSDESFRILIADDIFFEKNIHMLSKSKKIFLIKTTDKNVIQNVNNNEIFITETPFKISEFFTQIINLIKQDSIQQDRKLKFSSFSYDPKMRVLSNKDSSLRFTEKEAQIFQCLLNSSTYQSKKMLLKKVWSYDDKIDTHTLETHIYSLRKKIDKILLLRNLIIFEENKGYFLNKKIL